ncbi:hypothetical protein TUM3811_13090 [Shewanella algae]|nr:hypothetical protein TUM3811_13090 [Shewanella algae]
MILRIGNISVFVIQATRAFTQLIMGVFVAVLTLGVHILAPLRRKLRQVSADGAYDTKACHKLLRRKQAKPTIPPRSNAGYWEPGHPRNEAVDALKAGELKQWKLMNHYHQRSLSETDMYRYKQLISAKLSLRDYNGQVGEALAGVKALNKVIRLGMPVRQKIS